MHENLLCQVWPTLQRCPAHYCLFVATLQKVMCKVYVPEDPRAFYDVATKDMHIWTEAMMNIKCMTQLHKPTVSPFSEENILYLHWRHQWQHCAFYLHHAFLTFSMTYAIDFVTPTPKRPAKACLLHTTQNPLIILHKKWKWPSSITCKFENVVAQVIYAPPTWESIHPFLFSAYATFSCMLIIMLSQNSDVTSYLLHWSCHHFFPLQHVKEQWSCVVKVGFSCSPVWRVNQ